MKPIKRIENTKAEYDDYKSKSKWFGVDEIINGVRCRIYPNDPKRSVEAQRERYRNWNNRPDIKRINAMYDLVGDISENWNSETTDYKALINDMVKLRRL